MISSGPKLVLDSSLVLYLDAGNPASYPGSGASWFDLSGTGNTGTLFNSPTYSAANVGNFTFNGTNQYMEVTSPIVVPTGNITATLSCWVYPTATTPSVFQACFGYGGNSAAGDSFAIGLNSTTFNFTAEFNGGTTIASTTNIYTPNTRWLNIAATKTPGAVNTTTTIYFNGVQVSSSTAATLTPNVLNTKLRFGRWIFDTQPNYFSGNVSCGLIYNRALSASEILQNFNALRGRYGI